MWNPLWQDTLYSMEQELSITRLDWVEDSTQSVWNVCIRLDIWKENWKLSVLEGRECIINGKKCWEKPCK